VPAKLVAQFGALLENSMKASPCKAFDSLLMLPLVACPAKLHKTAAAWLGSETHHGSFFNQRMHNDAAFWSS